MSRILVTGMSGTGESSALAELGQRGYRVVDTDHPGWREYREYVDSSDEARRGEWLWVEERITGLLDSEDGRTLFVQGCVRNRDLWAPAVLLLVGFPAAIGGLALYFGYGWRRAVLGAAATLALILVLVSIDRAPGPGTNGGGGMPPPASAR